MKSDFLRLQNIELSADYKNAQVVNFCAKQSHSVLALDLLCFTSGYCIQVLIIQTATLEQYERPQTQYKEHIQPNWPCRFAGKKNAFGGSSRMRVAVIHYSLGSHRWQATFSLDTQPKKAISSMYITNITKCLKSSALFRFRILYRNLTLISSRWHFIFAIQQRTAKVLINFLNLHLLARF